MSQFLDATLKNLSRDTEEGGAEQRAALGGYSYAKLDDYPFNLEVLSLVPFETAQRLKFAAYVRLGDKIRVAATQPENEAVAAGLAELAENLQAELEVTLVSDSSFNLLLQSYAKLREDAAIAAEAAAEEAKARENKDYATQIQSIEQLADKIDGSNVTDILDALLAAAYNAGASDIHLEPAETELSVRLRIDGVLEPALKIPIAQHKGIISRIKMLASLKLDEHGANQDGRFSLEKMGLPVDIRVSMVPTGFGEGVVMRLLRRDAKAISLEELGFSQHNLERIETAMRRPYGLIVVTGPTGSGKSTTLYAILKKLNTTEKKIITLEDPIEYRIEGIQQSQIDNEKGFTFAEGLKGALRQDPDIVMVGEIRDPETATIALNASLTGHLVLTTMHTNDAATAHTRFLELGVAPFLLAGSINLVVAQRLVRKIVPGGTAEEPNYKGRVVIAETLIPTPEIERALQAGADARAVADLAIAGGMVPMLQDGLAKVKAGITTEAEVRRVTAG